MKQVILMRTDLDMSVGKMCAQAAHAGGGYDSPRVVLKVSSLEELHKYQNAALQIGRVRVKAIKDAGQTEVPPGTITCVAIGPADDKVIDKITGQLPLL